MIPPSEACLYGGINWSLAHAQQQSSMGLSQSFPPKRGSKTRPWTGSISWCRRDLYQGLVVLLWLRGLTCRVGMRLFPSGKKSAGGNVSTNSTNTRRKGGCGGWHSQSVMVLNVLITFICSFFRLAYFSIF